MRSSVGAMAEGFFSEPFQNTRMVETPFTEQSAAQSVCPGFANAPLMTLLGFFVRASCGIVHFLRSSSFIRLAGRPGIAWGDRRTIGSCGVWAKNTAANATKATANVISLDLFVLCVFLRTPAL